MAEAPVSETIAWGLGGVIVSLWDETLRDWRRVTTLAEKPCNEAITLYRTLLLELREAESYEWREDGKRYRMERWSAPALRTAAEKLEEWHSHPRQLDPRLY